MFASQDFQNLVSRIPMVDHSPQDVKSDTEQQYLERSDDDESDDDDEEEESSEEGARLSPPRPMRPPKNPAPRCCMSRWAREEKFSSRLLSVVQLRVPSTPVPRLRARHRSNPRCPSISPPSLRRLLCRGSEWRCLWPRSKRSQRLFVHFLNPFGC